MPNPFHRMHSLPDDEHLLGVVEDVDAIETSNLIAIPAYNEEAVRFAAKYRIRRGGGRTPNVAQASARCDPDARLRRAGGVPRRSADAEIAGRPSSR